jgi:hypothetical protein
MASNQNRYFTIHPVIGDSSKLRFSQACEDFNMPLFNAAAKSDKSLTIFIQALQSVARDQKEKSRKRSTAPLLLKSRTNFSLYRPRAIPRSPQH